MNGSNNINKNKTVKENTLKRLCEKTHCSEADMLSTSLTASQGFDCKQSVFFLKIGKAWCKSPTRAKREPRTPVGRVRREKKNVFLASLPSLALFF